MDYRKSGVDIDVGNEAIRRIKPHVEKTLTEGVLSKFGMFSGCFELDTAVYENPVLVSSMDGVGTKLNLASIAKKYHTIGACLVNHCVNDILVYGAKPVFFLDYYASGKLSLEILEEIILGVARACKDNTCALIGGETAEMPDIYRNDDFDLVGTIIGVVNKHSMITGKDIKKGDVLLGLPSNGLHTNGYSLARKVLHDIYHVELPEFNRPLLEVLLDEHKSYYSTVYPLVSQFAISGISHITGGGIVENTIRILPKGMSLYIDWNSWRVPFIFELIQKKGNVPVEDMRRTFNMGVGMILIMPQTEVDKVQAYLKNRGDDSFVIGDIV